MGLIPCRAVRGAFLSAFFLCVSLGHAGALYWKEVKKDPPELTRKHPAVVFWSVKVIGRETDFSNPLMTFMVKRYKESKGRFVSCYEGSSWHNKYIRIAGEWKKGEDGVQIYEGFAVKRIPAGRYQIHSLRFPMSYAISRLGGEAFSTHTFFDAFADREFELSYGLIYLGRFVIDITKTGEENFSYSVRIDRSEEDLKRDLAVLEKEYPRLAAAYRDTVFAVPLGPIQPRDGCVKTALKEDFTTNDRRWNIYDDGKFYNAYLRDGQYIMETKNDKISKEFIPIENLPYDGTHNNVWRRITCNIDLTSRWLSGGEHGGWGVVVGSAEKNYVFCVSKKGQAAVYLDESGNYTTLMDWTDVPVLGKENETVKQTLVADYPYVLYYVNGQYVKRIPMRLYVRRELKMTDKAVGVFVWDKQKVAFDDLEITYPKGVTW